MNLVEKGKRFFEFRETNKQLKLAKKDIFQSELGFEELTEKYVGYKKGAKELLAYCILEVACDESLHFLSDKRSKVYSKYHECIEKIGNARSLQPVIDLQKITAKIEFMLARLRISKTKSKDFQLQPAPYGSDQVA
ncbi:hypothetical protein ABN763_16135 [Spongiivirga sp. MCCC 1A20706]|uniref:hypothetical protein n=1 Tax=Spongiivirga sp. MCCC 1A20706 TaxID=3160963 RepID=UPI003977D329